MSEPNDLEARKTELFATMTLIKAAKRDLALAQARGDDQLPLIDRLADLEADRERLAHEVNSQYMYRNLLSVLVRVDDAEKRLSNEIGGLRTGQTDLQAEFHAGLSGIQATVSVLVETVDDLQGQMRESQADRKTLHATDTAILKEVAGVKKDVGTLKKELTTYIRGSRRGEVDVLQQRVTTFETKVAADIQMRLESNDTRLTELESNRAELQGIRDELREARELLKALAARLGDALPTEADQDLSAQLRVDEAKRGHGRREAVKPADGS